MLLTIKDERLCHLIETFAHQGYLHLVLNILHLDIILDIQVADNLGDSTQVSGFVNTLERLGDGVHNLV